MNKKIRNPVSRNERRGFCIWREVTADEENLRGGGGELLRFLA